MPEDTLVTELAGRLTGIAIISSDISASDIAGQDIESLAAHIIDHLKDSEKPAIMTKEMLAKISSGEVKI